MKLREIKDPSTNESVIRPFNFHIGDRDEVFGKMVVTPFAKRMEKDFKALGAKWNGSDGYDFKSTESEAKGVPLMAQYHDEWKQILKDNPEGESKANMVDRYFKHVKKNGIK